MADDPTPDPVFGKVAGVLAGGSAIITGVLTFLGIKENALDRVLREEPKAILLFGALIAIAVTLGAVVKFVHVPGSYPVIWVVVASVALIFLFPVIANLARKNTVPGGQNLWLIYLAVFVAAAIVVSLAGGLRLSSGGCLLVVGAIFFGLGTYGSVRISIDSKNLTASPQIVEPTTARKEDGLLYVTGTAKAADLDPCERLLLTARGIRLGIQPGDADGKAEIKFATPVSTEMVDDGNALTLLGSIGRDHCDSAEDARRPMDAPRPLHSGARLTSHERGGTRSRHGDPEHGEHRQPAGESDRPDRVAVARIQLAPSMPAPQLSGKWIDATTTEWTVRADDQFSVSTTTVIVMGRGARGCEVIGYSAIPVAASGDVNVTVPVKVAEDVTELEGRADFTDNPPRKIAASTTCSARPRSHASTLVLRRYFPMP